jgi:hypothetical protein
MRCLPARLRRNSFSPIVLILAMVVTSTAAAAAAEQITIAPAIDVAAVLHNPDMGWVVYENYPVDPRPNGSSTLLGLPKENFDGVDHVAVMFSWADVEREPGVFDFRDVDRAYDYWRARGKQIQLRMSTESLLWWSRNDPSRGVGVPRHVLDKIPPAHKQRRSEGGFDYDLVDARDEIYLAALDQFLAAVSKNFSSDRPVTLIDLRGFGLWGEWHSGYKYPDLASRRAALVNVIDHWSRAFPDHHLALSYSHDPEGPKEFFDGPTLEYDANFTKNYDKFLAWSAFDHALTKPNITWRRDGVGGAVYSNQRRLCEEAFAKLSRGPFMSEFLGGYSPNKAAGEKWLTTIINDALSIHPNYISLLGWQGGDALAFIREQPELFNRALREMGYRLVPTQVTYPSSITPKETFTIEMTWQNRGVGRALRDYHLCVIVGDKQINAGAIETSRWVKGQNYAIAKELKLPDIEPGSYPLHLAVIDPTTNKPIALPLKDGAMGTITITPQ